MESVVIYRCYDCGIKRVISTNSLPEYVELDKIHHNHSGYIMIEKIADKYTIDKIINEWYIITSAELKKTGELYVYGETNEREENQTNNSEGKGE